MGSRCSLTAQQSHVDRIMARRSGQLKSTESAPLMLRCASARALMLPACGAANVRWDVGLENLSMAVGFLRCTGLLDDASKQLKGSLSIRTKRPSPSEDDNLCTATRCLASGCSRKRMLLLRVFIGVLLFSETIGIACMRKDMPKHGLTGGRESASCRTCLANGQRDSPCRWKEFRGNHHHDGTQGHWV